MGEHIKLKQAFLGQACTRSKYVKIISITHKPGRPGEDFYEVVDNKGNKYSLSPNEKRSLDKLIKK